MRRSACVFLFLLAVGVMWTACDQEQPPPPQAVSASSVSWAATKSTCRAQPQMNADERSNFRVNPR